MQDTENVQAPWDWVLSRAKECRIDSSCKIQEIAPAPWDWVLSRAFENVNKCKKQKVYMLHASGSCPEDMVLQHRFIVQDTRNCTCSMGLGPIRAKRHIIRKMLRCAGQTSDAALQGEPADKPKRAMTPRHLAGCTYIAITRKEDKGQRILRMETGCEAHYDDAEVCAQSFDS